MKTFFNKATIFLLNVACVLFIMGGLMDIVQSAIFQLPRGPLLGAVMMLVGLASFGGAFLLAMKQWEREDARRLVERRLERHCAMR